MTALRLIALQFLYVRRLDSVRAFARAPRSQQKVHHGRARFRALVLAPAAVEQHSDVAPRAVLARDRDVLLLLLLLPRAHRRRPRDRRVARVARRQPVQRSRRDVPPPPHALQRRRSRQRAPRRRTPAAARLHLRHRQRGVHARGKPAPRRWRGSGDDVHSGHGARRRRRREVQRHPRLVVPVERVLALVVVRDAAVGARERAVLQPRFERRAVAASQPRAPREAAEFGEERASARGRFQDLNRRVAAT
eukprot:29427-Pelagococcus_subviridis.AAC.9